MLIFELLDQYAAICRSAFFRCGGKLNTNSNLPFVKGLREIGFSLISRLRSDAVLYYIYEGPRTGKRGRPKTKDGKIDFSNLEENRMSRID